jgi:error-prone DNA polymerase
MAGMLARGYAREFAEALCQQIQGFGSYGFPESHAASFALLVYVSAWLKRFEPAAFLCGLLNSQPMGFYGPSQLIQDARRHQVEVLPADAAASDWECTLEARPGERPPAARLGLRLVKGFNAAAAERISRARQRRPRLGGRPRPPRRPVDRRAAHPRLGRRAGQPGRPPAPGLVGRRRQPGAPGMLHDAPVADPPPPCPPPAKPRTSSPITPAWASASAAIRWSSCAPSWAPSAS